MSPYPAKSLSYCATTRLFLTLALVLLPALGAAQSANDGFNPNANGVAQTLAVQMDRKLIFTGDFTMIDGMARFRLAVLSLH
ncbi:MAG: hypothetical protein WBP11_05805 [Dokdonella sp.]